MAQLHDMSAMGETMPRSLVHVLKLACLTAGACATIAGAGAATITAVPPAVYQPAPTAKALDAETLLTPASAPQYVLTLPAPTADEKSVLKAASQTRNAKGLPTTSGKGRPLEIGFPRTLVTGDGRLDMDSLPWQAVSDGIAARVSVTSKGAAAVRLGISLPQTDPDITFRFVGSDRPQQVFGPYPANKLAQTKIYWSPVLEGETATMEIFLPSGVSPRSVSIAMPQLSHLVKAGADLLKAEPESDIGRSGACESDIACVNPSTALRNQAKAVAKMLFTTGGHTFICTGTLLNDSTATNTPYFYTASHCMDSQEAAGTLNTYWFFDAVSCKSTAVPPYQLVAGGSMLLGRSGGYDWALVRLNNPPPAGAVFSSWRAEPLPIPSPITVVHHPEGDLKKVSQGSVFQYFTFGDGSTFAEARYSQGTTEEGSSGSGLLTIASSGSFYELRGGLFAGDAACTNPGGSDYYSRLDKALPLLTQYLTPNAPNPTRTGVVVEFYNGSLDDYFVTANPAEINDLDTGVHPGWVRTGLRFLAYTDGATAPPDASPVCRFYVLPQFGDSHFYSADPTECAQTAARFSGQWFFECPSVFYIQLPNRTTGACPANTHAVYRFLNRSNQLHHRYTAEVDVRDSMIASGSWIQEGYGAPPDAPVMCSPNG